MANENFDVVVIGGGPAGYVAGIRAGQLGLRVAVVEKEHMGGVCLNWGCIPSKALIAAANSAERARESSHMGIKVSGVEVDVNKLQDWKEGIVKKLTGGVRQLVTGNGGEVFDGTAKIVGKGKVEVSQKGGKKVTLTAAKGILVATGSRVTELPFLKVDGKVVITAKEAVSLRRLPKSLILIGGGVIGLELGMVYQKLGAKVTVVEFLDQLLPSVDKDLAQVVTKAFTKAGGTVLTGAKATACTVKGSEATVTVEHEGSSKKLTGDTVLVAVGFKPNTQGLGLEEVGAKLDERGHVLVDKHYETKAKGIFAVGDIAGMPYLAHKASKEAEIAVEYIAGHASENDIRAMPAAIFTEPEIATVGLSERDAKAQKRDIKIGKFPFAASGRAMAVDSTAGFVKVLIDAKTHEVLGAGIVGPDASDLIAEAALAIEMGAFAEDVALTVHAHPTLSEGLMEAFKHALGEAVHVMNR